MICLLIFWIMIIRFTDDRGIVVVGIESEVFNQSLLKMKTSEECFNFYSALLLPLPHQDD